MRVSAEEGLFTSDDSAEIPPTDIISYNELRSCADLFRMYSKGILDMQPEFQRDVVWAGTDQTRFIDSLVKELPIPSMCFAQDGKNQKWIVIDGLQRMATIVRFLEGADWKLSKLDDIDQKLAGLSVAAIKNSKGELHEYYSRVENLTIPITVLRCEFSKKNHMEFLFTIFHRLNSGGSKLSNQEIRNGIYGGSFNSLLGKLDKNDTWRKLNKIKKIGTYRYKYQEVILRFFAFHEKLESYDGSLAKFLNSYMHENRMATDTKISAFEQLFDRTIDIYWRVILKQKPPVKKIPITILEATLVAIATNINHIESIPSANVVKMYDDLLDHDVFSMESRKEGLAKKERVLERFRTAIGIFSGR